MFKNFSKITTPKTTIKWTNLSEKERIYKVQEFLKIERIDERLKIVKVPSNGQLEFELLKDYSASERGPFLLEVEKKIKDFIDIGLTIWCVPVGDKSKLRKLRGLTIKT